MVYIVIILKTNVTHPSCNLVALYKRQITFSNTQQNYDSFKIG